MPLTSRNKIQYDAGAMSMYTVYTFILAYTYHTYTYTHIHTYHNTGAKTVFKVK